MTRKEFDKEAESYMDFGTELFEKEPMRNPKLEEKFWNFCKNKPPEFAVDFFQNLKEILKGSFMK